MDQKCMGVIQLETCLTSTCTSISNATQMKCLHRIINKHNPGTKIAQNDVTRVVCQLGINFKTSLNDQLQEIVEEENINENMQKLADLIEEHEKSGVPAKFSCTGNPLDDMRAGRVKALENATDKLQVLCAKSDAKYDQLLQEFEQDSAKILKAKEVNEKLAERAQLLLDTIQ